VSTAELRRPLAAPRRCARRSSGFVLEHATELVAAFNPISDRHGKSHDIRPRTGLAGMQPPRPPSKREKQDAALASALTEFGGQGDNAVITRRALAARNRRAPV
jgi:hypothetical protein